MVDNIILSFTVKKCHQLDEGTKTHQEANLIRRQSLSRDKQIATWFRLSLVSPCASLSTPASPLNILANCKFTRLHTGGTALLPSAYTNWNEYSLWRYGYVSLCTLGDVVGGISVVERERDSDSVCLSYVNLR